MPWFEEFSKTYAGWVMVWRVWLGQQRPIWLPRLTAGLTLLLMVSTVLGEESVGTAHFALH